MKPLQSFETQVNITSNTWQHIPEDLNLQQQCCENEIRNIPLSHLREHEPISCRSTYTNELLTLHSDHLLTVACTK